MSGPHPQEKSKSYAKQIWSFAKPFRLSFINLYFCVIITSFMGMLYPFLFGMLIDEVFYHRNMDFFKIIVVGYGIIYLSELLLHLLLNATWTYLMTRFLFDIRRKMYEKLLSLKASFFHKIQTGDAMTLINRDTEQIMNLIHNNVFFFSANVVRLLTAIIFVMFINVYIGLLMLVVVPVAVMITLIFGRFMKKQLVAERKTYGNFISWMVEMLSGLRDIRLLAAERNVTRQFIHFGCQMIRLKNKVSRIEWMSERSVAFVSLLSDLTLYATAGIMIVKGNLTVGGFIAMIEYFTRANLILKNISEANTRLQQNKVSIDKVLGLLEEEVEAKRENVTELVVQQAELVFHNVSFQYEGEKDVLRNVNLTILGGETVFLSDGAAPEKAQ